MFLSRIVSSHCAWLFFISSSFIWTLLKLSSNTCCGFRPIKKAMILHEAVKEKKHTWKNKMKQNGQMKKQEKMHKFLWLLYPYYDFELFAHPLTLCVINYGLIFFLHFSKKTIYFFLGKGALLISYQKNISIIILRYSFLPVSFEILDTTCINTIQL